MVLGACSPRQLKWVAIGDSITYLNEYRDETGNRVSKGYLTRVAEERPDIKYVNKGYNGWTSGGIADHIDSLGLESADIFSVFLGTNDWWRGRPIGSLDDYKNKSENNTIFGSYRIIIDKLRTLNKDAQIILIAPMQRVDFVYLNNMKNNAYGSYKEKEGQSLADVADAIVAIARYEKCDFVDLFHDSGMTLDNLVKYKRLKDPATGNYRNYTYPDFIEVPFDPETDDYPYPVDAIGMTYDGLHPSDEGYEVIAKMLLDVMRKP